MFKEGTVEQQEVRIDSLPSGSAFILLVGDTQKRGVLVERSACSATVQLMEKKSRTITTFDGTERTFESLTGLQHWSLETPVIPTGERVSVAEFTAKLKGESQMAKQKAPKAKSEGRKPTLAPYVSDSFKIYGNHDGKEYEATVLSSGVVRYKDKDYTSPSAAAKVIVGVEVNGFVFWKYGKNGERQLLNAIRGKDAIKVAAPKPKKAKVAKAKKARKAKVPKVAPVEEKVVTDMEVPF
jgi:hypothetical protein